MLGNSIGCNLETKVTKLAMSRMTLVPSADDIHAFPHPSYAFEGYASEAGCALSAGNHAVVPAPSGTSNFDSMANVARSSTSDEADEFHSVDVCDAIDLLPGIASESLGKKVFRIHDNECVVVSRLVTL